MNEYLYISFRLISILNVLWAYSKMTVYQLYICRYIYIYIYILLMPSRWARQNHTTTRALSKTDKTEKINRKKATVEMACPLDEEYLEKSKRR